MSYMFTYLSLPCIMKSIPPQTCPVVQIFIFVLSHVEVTMWNQTACTVWIKLHFTIRIANQPAEITKFTLTKENVWHPNCLTTSCTCSWAIPVSLYPTIGRGTLHLQFCLPCLHLPVVNHGLKLSREKVCRNQQFVSFQFYVICLGGESFLCPIHPCRVHAPPAVMLFYLLYTFIFPH